MDLRTLSAPDAPALEHFLARHADSSMFMRSNARAGGLEYQGRTYQAVYLARFEAGRIVGVVAHCWNGMLMCQAPERIGEMAVAVAARSRRDVRGLIGPSAQVARACGALGIDRAGVQMDSREDLFAISTAALRPPATLGSSAVCRRPTNAELPLLADWAFDYHREALHASPSEKLREQCRETVRRLQAMENQFVLEVDGRLVAYSAFNARLPDMVQVGGVWTPPALRRRGFARAVVAGSLIEARDHGVTRAILFTDVANAPARRAYLALGFEIVGDYALVLCH